MSILLSIIGASTIVPGGGTEDAAVLSSPWAPMNATWPNSQNIAGDRIVTWTIGGSRSISVNYGGNGFLSYRINNGIYIPYSSSFFLQSGETLGWRMFFSDNETAAVVVFETGTTTRTLDSIPTYATGFP